MHVIHTALCRVKGKNRAGLHLHVIPVFYHQMVQLLGVTFILNQHDITSLSTLDLQR